MNRENYLQWTVRGQFRLLPRIKLATLESDLLFILTRKQFPIRFCFAVTVSKSQGQSLKTPGVDLRTPAFTRTWLSFGRKKKFPR